MTKVASTARVLNRRRLRLGKGATVDHFAVVGLRNPYPGVFDRPEQRVVEIGAGATVGCYALIFEGARLGERVVVEPRGLIGSRTNIGAGTRLLYGAQVHDHVAIGKASMVAGFIADNCRIGDECHVFGSLIHRYSNPDARAWDTTDEQGPTLGDGVIVGWGAILIGPITVGRGARIRPGAIVRRSVREGRTIG